ASSQNPHRARQTMAETTPVANRRTTSPGSHGPANTEAPTMADIIILGAGMNGLTAAMLLANDGYSVTALERDPAEPPADADAAWREWERRGVGHFRLPHFILPRWRTEMAAMLPAVLTEAERLGARRFN